ncbi:asparaginase [Cognatishimia sp.]|uniref:asparaginase n=1 Tax=Cognatishimia sp. TaxID=2211648 RepID=UPI0035111685
MVHSVPLVEITRGPILESIHYGDAVVCNAEGEIVHAWGDPDKIVLPRSSSKMLQALPLIESGAADAFGLTDAQLALACASHGAQKIHTDSVAQWLSDLGLSESDLRCGSHEPSHKDSRRAMLLAGETPCQLHNNCSGKHTGFLTLNKHLGGHSEYVDIDHPVQRACLTAFQELTGETSPGFGIDGCSAPNHAVSLHGMARAMGFFAGANPDGDTRNRAAYRLHRAMAKHPVLLSAEGRACERLINAAGNKIAVKTGAEAFFIAILPEQKLGVALKITDGSTRAAECAIAAILVKLGALDPAHPHAQRYINWDIKNANGWSTGRMRPADVLN